MKNINAFQKEIMEMYPDLHWHWIDQAADFGLLYLSKDDKFHVGTYIAIYSENYIYYYPNCGHGGTEIHADEIKKYHKLETAMKNFI